MLHLSWRALGPHAVAPIRLIDLLGGHDPGFEYAATGVRGGRAFETHQDTEKEPGMFGTMTSVLVVHVVRVVLVLTPHRLQRGRDKQREVVLKKPSTRHYPTLPC